MAWLPDVRMRLIGRNDVFLLVGLAIALFAIFSGPLGRLLEFVSQIDDARGYRLLPGRVILAVVYTIHQQRKRVEMRAAAMRAEMGARLASARAAEMERLVAFGQALARSLDQESIRNTSSEHLPLLAAGRGAWVMTRNASGWELLAAAG